MYTVNVNEFRIFMMELTDKILASNNNPAVILQAKKDYHEMKSKVNPQSILNLGEEVCNILNKFEKTLEVGLDPAFKNKAFLFMKSYMDQLLEYVKKERTQQQLFAEYERIYTSYLQNKSTFLKENPEITDLSDLALFEEKILDLLARKETMAAEQGYFEA